MPTGSHRRPAQTDRKNWLAVMLLAALSLALVAIGARVAQADTSPIVTGCPSDTEHTLAANDDGSTDAVNIGFPVNFFGTTYTQLYVNNNGNVTFGSAESDFTPFGLTGDVNEPIIAPFFADVDTTGVDSGLVTYGPTVFDGKDAFCANWINVGYFEGHTDKRDSFQLLLVDRGPGNDPAAGDDFDILFNYGSMQWETGDASEGENGLGGECAAAGYSNGLADSDNVSYELPGSHICGALIDGGPDSLSAGSNGGTAGRFQFQARSGTAPVPVTTSTPTPTDTDTATPTPTVTSSATTKIPVQLTDVSAVDSNGTVTLGARLVRTDTGDGVPNEPLTFTLSTPDVTPTSTPTPSLLTGLHAHRTAVRPHVSLTPLTNSSGYAFAALPLSSPEQALTVDFLGDQTYQRATYPSTTVGTILTSPPDTGPGPVAPPPSVTPSPTQTVASPSETPSVTPTSAPARTSASPTQRATPSARATTPAASHRPTPSATTSSTRVGTTLPEHHRDTGAPQPPNAQPTVAVLATKTSVATTPSASANSQAAGVVPSAPTYTTPPSAGAGQPTPTQKAAPPAGQNDKPGSRFGNAIGDFRQVDFPAKKLGENAALVLAGTLIVLFPAELLNKTLHENYDEIAGWFAPLTRRLRRRRKQENNEGKEQRRRRTLRTVLSGAGFLAAASIIYGIGQPEFRFDAENLRVILGLAIGLVIISIGGNHAAVAFARRRYHAEGSHKFRHGTLAVAIVCVVVSRLTNFEPGYTYGLIAGFVLDRQLGARREARAVLSLAGYLLTMAVAGWLLLVPARAWLAHSPEQFWADLAVDVCTALTVEGLTGLALALLPLKFMEGERLLKASRLLWVATYGVVLFVFLQLVVDPSFVHHTESHVPLLTWVSLFIGFGVVSVGAWAYFAIRHRGEEEGEGEEERTRELERTIELNRTIDLTDGVPTQRRAPDGSLHPTTEG